MGLEGRYGLLQRLGAALDASPQFFGTEVPRPGNVVDYVLANVSQSLAFVSSPFVAYRASYHEKYFWCGCLLQMGADGKGEVSIKVLWKAIIEVPFIDVHCLYDDIIVRVFKQGLESIWPQTAAGVRRGDVWVYSPLKARFLSRGVIHFSDKMVLYVIGRSSAKRLATWCHFTS